MSGIFLCQERWWQRHHLFLLGIRKKGGEEKKRKKLETKVSSLDKQYRDIWTAKSFFRRSILSYFNPNKYSLRPKLTFDIFVTFMMINYHYYDDQLSLSKSFSGSPSQFRCAPLAFSISLLSQLSQCSDIDINNSKVILRKTLVMWSL